MNPKFLAPKDPYLYPRGNRLRAWVWAMLNHKAALECDLLFFGNPEGCEWRRFNLGNGSWFFLQASFIIRRPDITAVLADEIWHEYGDAYGLSKEELERTINPIPF